MDKKYIQWAENTSLKDLIKYQSSLSRKLHNLTMSKDELEIYEVILIEIEKRLARVK